MNSHTRRHLPLLCFDWFERKKCAKLFVRQIQSVNKRHSICQEPTTIRRIYGFGVNSAAKILQIFDMCKKKVYFLRFLSILRTWSRGGGSGSRTLRSGNDVVT